jgi:hypothetical protein
VIVNKYQEAEAIPQDRYEILGAFHAVNIPVHVGRASAFCQWRVDITEVNHKRRVSARTTPFRMVSNRQEVIRDHHDEENVSFIQGGHGNAERAHGL